MYRLLSPRSLQRKFLFNCEFHRNYLIGYLIGYPIDYLMFDVIITSPEIFKLLLECNIMCVHNVCCPSPSNQAL